MIPLGSLGEGREVQLISWPYDDHCLSDDLLGTDLRCFNWGNAALETRANAPQADHTRSTLKAFIKTCKLSSSVPAWVRYSGAAHLTKAAKRKCDAGRCEKVAFLRTDPSVRHGARKRSASGWQMTGVGQANIMEF
jgi:hypothetical protein